MTQVLFLRLFGRNSILIFIQLLLYSVRGGLSKLPQCLGSKDKDKGGADCADNKGQMIHNYNSEDTQDEMASSSREGQEGGNKKRIQGQTQTNVENCPWQALLKLRVRIQSTFFGCMCSDHRIPHQRFAGTTDHRQGEGVAYPQAAAFHYSSF